MTVCALTAPAPTPFRAALRACLSSGRFADVRLVCADGVCRAHALVLAAASRFWAEMLGHAWSGAQGRVLRPGRSIPSFCTGIS